MLLESKTPVADYQGNSLEVKSYKPAINIHRSKQYQYSKEIGHDREVRSFEFGMMGRNGGKKLSNNKSMCYAIANQDMVKQQQNLLKLKSNRQEGKSISELKKSGDVSSLN